MKNLKFGLMVVGTLLLFMPSALALNCTLYYGQNHDLCTTVNPLPISEYEKYSLMQSDVYGQVTQQSQSATNLKLDVSSNQQLTFNQVYEQNIALVVKIGLFIFVNYAIFSILTKPSIIRKWLAADS